MDNLYDILKSGGIFPYNTNNKNRDVEFISLTDDDFMLMINRDVRYSNHNIRIEVELSPSDVTKVEYNLDFFRNNPNIASHLFTDLNDDFDFLYDDNYNFDSTFDFLKIENEYVTEDYISIKDFKLVTLVEGPKYKFYRSESTMENCELLMSDLNIRSARCYSWECISSDYTYSW
jgi:hypothetical protein